jgi:hypothetical protein
LARRSRSVVSSGIVALVAGSTSLAQSIGNATQRIGGGSNDLAGWRNGGIGGADRPTDLFGKGGGRLIAKIINSIKRCAELVLRRERAEAIGEALHIKRCQSNQQVHQQQAQRKEQRRRSCWAGRSVEDEEHKQRTDRTTENGEGE